MTKADGLQEMNPRSCIVTREASDRENLIRFVASPDGVITPDLKGNLPGRGVWVTGQKKYLVEAVAKKLFSRALKKQVQADDDLPELVEKLIAKRALNSLAMAKKAGVIISGMAKVDSAVRSGKVVLLLHANDGAADGKRKLASATAFVDHMEGDKIDVFECWSIEEMSVALGIGNAVHIAAVYGGATNNLKAAILQLQEYRSN